MSTNKKAKPFLKWAGGKKQIIDFVDKKLPHSIEESGVIDKYFEPFVGGGAIFFHLIGKYEITEAHLGDTNKELILTYLVVRDNPEQLISKLKEFESKWPELIDDRKEKYYEIREQFNDNLVNFDYKNFNSKKFSEEHILRASQMIFLNKTCFNGLYRVNKSGEFNVPIGRYKDPRICDENNILKVSDVLEGVDIVCDDYSKFEKSIDENSFVYLDPPYLPIKKTSFTSYTSKSFGVTEQERLSEFCRKINDNGAKFMLSNSKPTSSEFSNFFNENYKKSDFGKLTIDTIQDAKRYINSNGKKRSNIQEILIYNY